MTVRTGVRLASSSFHYFFLFFVKKLVHLKTFIPFTFQSPYFMAVYYFTQANLPSNVYVCYY